MTAIIRPVTALLMSAAIILAANGLEGLLLPLRGAIEDFSSIEIGLLGASYFAGLTLGCLIVPHIIARVGHIRSFLLFAALATTSPLLEAMQPDPVLWWLFRCLTGICFAGIMNVVESWLTSLATNADRGRIMSTYAVINFASLTAGQQLINLASPDDFRLFSIIAILCALAAIPLSLTLSQSPPPPIRPRFRLGKMYKVSPAAVAGCFGAGLANGACWSLGPVYARDSGLPPSLIATFMSLAVLGGAFAQWPVGRLSDSVDRRWVLMALCLGAALTGIGLFLAAAVGTAIKLSLAALFGAFILPVYWISSAHANDLADPGEAVSVSASLLLLFSTGAIFGPIFAALLKQEFGHGIVFLYTAGIHVLVMLAILYRTTQRGRAPAEDRVSYEELPVSSTPAVFELASADAESDSEGDQAVDVEHGPPAKP
jgi:MFS family permease